jgi:hypothetical protein
MKILTQFKNLFWPDKWEKNYAIKRVAGVVVLLVALYLIIKIIGG